MAMLKLVAMATVDQKVAPLPKLPDVTMTKKMEASQWNNK